MTARSADPSLLARLAQLQADGLEWITGHSNAIALAALLGAAIVAALIVARTVGRRLCANAATHGQPPPVLGRALAKTRLWFMLAVAAHIVARYAHAPDDLAQTIRFVFVIAATLQAAVFARELILGIVETRAVAREGLGSALGIIRLLVTVALFAIAVVVVLSNLGVNVTGIVAGLGIGGIAIGLAAQGIFKDLFAALSILFDAPFRVGDLIRFGDVTGRVEAIGLKTTRIRSLDGEEVVMSNDRLLDQQLRNFRGVARHRIVLRLPLHYRNPAEKLAALPTALAVVIGAIPDARFDQALLGEFRDAAVVLEVVLHTDGGDAATRDRVRHAAMVAMLAHLESQEVALF